MKGQIFIAGTALFIVLLVLMRSSITAPTTSGTTLLVSEQIKNLGQEYRHAIALSALTGSDRLDELSDYFRTNVREFDAIYSIITTQSGSYMLTIGNFLSNEIDVHVSATESTPATIDADILDKEAKTWSITSTGNVMLTINYTLQNIVYTKSIGFTASVNQTIGWFDIGIRSDGENTRNSDVWSVESAALP